MDVKVAEGDTMMVRFKDYGFFVPKEGVEDLRTVMHGTAKLIPFLLIYCDIMLKMLVKQKTK